MSTPLSKIQMPMPASSEILNQELSWICSRGDRYQFLNSAQEILEYQLCRKKNVYATLTLEKSKACLSSNDGSSVLSRNRLLATGSPIRLSLRINISIIRKDITGLLNKYRQYIVNYEDIISKKTSNLRVTSSSFTKEDKKAFEAFGVAEELSQIISDTMNLFDFNSSTSASGESDKAKPRTILSDPTSNSSLALKSDTNSNSNHNSGSILHPTFTVSNNINTTVNATSRNKRRYMQVGPTGTIENKATNVIRSLKREKSNSLETELQDDKNPTQVTPLLLSKNLKNETSSFISEETYSITRGSYEHFKSNDESTLVFTRSKRDNGILQLFLSKSMVNDIFSNNTRKIAYSIKIVLDLSNVDFHKMASFYRSKLRLEDLKTGNQMNYIFDLDPKGYLQSCPLKQGHFIFLLGKIMMPDEIIKELSEIVRTYSNCYNQTQTQTETIFQQKSISDSSESTVAISQDGDDQAKTHSKSLTMS